MGLPCLAVTPDSDSVDSNPPAGIFTNDGLIVDSVEICNRNIYDAKDGDYDHFIFKIANKLHIKTRKSIVERELLLKKGDTYSQALAEETARNIRQKLIVYDAWSEVETLPDGRLLWRVVTVDQWSFNGGVNYGREGNETRWQIGFDEKNFLGYNQFVSFYYYNQSDDDNYIEGSIADRRFWGKRLRIQLDYSSNPFRETAGFTLQRPYYDLEQTTYFSLISRTLSGRRDIYSDNLKVAESRYDGEATEFLAAYRLGKYREKLRFQFSYDYRNERTVDRTFLTGDPDDIALAISSFPNDTLYHQFGLATAYSNFDYAKMHRVDGFGYTEDYLLGYFGEGQFSRAFNAAFDDHRYDRADLFLARYFGFRSGLLLVDYEHSLWYRATHNFRRVAALSVRFYQQPSSYFTIALRSAYISAWNSEDREDILLGGTTGIRGYDKYFKTGNRKALVNVEGRFYSGVKFLSALFGAVVFADWGSIWKTNEAITLDNSYASAGVGLRVAFEKSTKNIVRIDVAYSEQTSWQLSIGTDQYFRAQSFD
jgi:outer membrane protein assembly factor BamA